MPKKSKMTIRQAVAKILGVSTREEILRIYTDGRLIVFAVPKYQEDGEAWNVLRAAYSRFRKRNMLPPSCHFYKALLWGTIQVEKSASTDSKPKDLTGIEIKERPAEWSDQIEPPQKKKKTRDDKTLTQTPRPTTVARTFQPEPTDNNYLPVPIKNLLRKNGWVVSNKQKKKDIGNFKKP